jgi:regulator of sigma E protease
MEILAMVGQLLLGLSIIVGLHELGHLLAAKMFGMRVEKYFIGFPPKVWSITRGGTEYGIGAIPLGGFVKISGMIDESMDKDQMNRPPEPWEFRSKPAWQRLIVMLGGIIVNIIVGIIIFIGISYTNGKEYVTRDEVNKHGIFASTLAEEIGFKTGDRILKINGKDFENFDDAVISSDIFLGSNSYYTVLRDGQEIRIDVPNDFIEKLSEPGSRANFLQPGAPFVIGEISPGQPAEKAGLLKGDQIIAVNGQSTPYFQLFKQQLEALKGQTAELSVVRNHDTLSVATPITEEGTIGFSARFLLNYVKIEYTFPQAVAEGTKTAFNAVFSQVKAFGKIFRGEVSATKSISGPIGIAQMFGGVWDWGKFWFLTGLLSMILAFMNALPIPALDGGHSVILLFEMISGHKPSDKFLEKAQVVGMVLLLGLMAFAIFNDVWKVIF